MNQQTRGLFPEGITAPEVARIRGGDGASESGFSAVITEALRRAVIAKFFATLGADGQLRSDLRMVCTEAKRQNLRVEHLIIGFKDSWRALPEARLLPRGTQGPELLNKVITLCIAEFYSARGD